MPDPRVGSAGAALATLEAGVGGRPLLLCHGFTGAKEDFGDWVDRFAADGWWVVAPDLPGHGASPQPAGEASYSISRYARDVLDLADGSGWDRFAMVGHSMGGMVAQELALTSPERIDRLVLMDTHHGPVEGLDPETVAFGLGVVREQGLRALLDLLAALPAEPRAASDQRLRDERPGYAQFADAKARVCSADMYAAIGSELVGRADRLAELAGLTLPTRIVVGAEDRGFLAAAHRMAEAMPSADLVVVPDAAHSPQFENPEPWWDAVAPFLSGPG